MFDRKLKVKNHLNKNRTSLKKSWNILNMFDFDGDLSDQCLDLAMNKNCESNFKCFDYLLIENATGYKLTHQLFYFIILQHVKKKF